MRKQQESATTDLYGWDTSRNDGLGDRALAQSGVSYTINFHDSGTSGKSPSDTFGIQIVYMPLAPQLLKGSDINMCVLNRSFAIKQLVRWGMRVALIGELTDAMYNPVMRPYVSHSEGTRLVIEHIQKFWAPTISSDQLRVEQP